MVIHFAERVQAGVQLARIQLWALVSLVTPMSRVEAIPDSVMKSVGVAVSAMLPPGNGIFVIVAPLDAPGDPKLVKSASNASDQGCIEMMRALLKLMEAGRQGNS